MLIHILVYTCRWYVYLYFRLTDLHRSSVIVYIYMYSCAVLTYLDVVNCLWIGALCPYLNK